ncbi:hypothetical protein BB560_004281 [Smittium megazygosporum]|uniref:Extracellular membrane protein CFEM domain-containing protein n=1 Tax=Smittium megazygosporum TaxID=133381 RepID=A0A2T9Z9U6_9FUNG|nr:hypothetical protein BB560_004281 [Smittium megazygosporum]
MKLFTGIILLPFAGIVAAQDLLASAQQECLANECKNDVSNSTCADKCISDMNVVLNIIVNNSACAMNCRNNIPSGSMLSECIQNCKNPVGDPGAENPNYITVFNQCVGSECNDDYSDRKCIIECLNKPGSVSNIIDQRYKCIQNCNNSISTGPALTGCVQNCISEDLPLSNEPTQTEISDSFVIATASGPNTATTSQPTSSTSSQSATQNSSSSSAPTLKLSLGVLSVISLSIGCLI